MADNDSSEPRATFADGVAWGMYVSTFGNEDSPRSDMDRTRVLSAIVDQIDLTPYAPLWTLRALIIDRWGA